MALLEAGQTANVTLMDDTPFQENGQYGPKWCINVLINGQQQKWQMPNDKIASQVRNWAKGDTIKVERVPMDGGRSYYNVELVQPATMAPGAPATIQQYQNPAEPPPSTEPPPWVGDTAGNGQAFSEPQEVPSKPVPPPPTIDDRTDSILRQVAFKGAIELAGSGRITVTQIRAYTDDFHRLLRGRPA